MKYKICLCAIIKDELDLEEWVVYNHLIGFEHIFIYDNGSKVPIKVRLNRYLDFVTVIDFPMTGTLRQRAAYNHFRVNFGLLTEWVAYFDADEYLVLKKHSNVGELLNEFKDCDGLTIHWMMFGPNGHEVRPPGLVIENYTTREAQHHSDVKSIVKPAAMIKCKVHKHIMRKGAKYVDPLRNPATHPSKVKDKRITAIVQINHYFTRSTEDWERRLRRRQITHKVVRDWHTFNYYKKQCIVKDRILIEQGYVNKIKEFILSHEGLPSDFNWMCYLYLNLDLIKYKCSKDFLIRHWLNQGCKEGRRYISDDPNINKVINFDWKFYLNLYKDLQKAKIDTQEKALKHFLLYGIKENRKYNDH